MASPTDASYNTPSTAVPAKSSRRPANIDLTMPSSTSSSVATSPRSPPAFATRPRVPVGTSATTDNLRLGPPPSVLGNPLCAGQQVHPLKTSQGATSGLTSPCFVHNHLDTSLASFLAEERRRQEKVAKSKGKQRSASEATVSDSDSEDDAQSLTRQLAETAVSVREMSKQLGAYPPSLFAPWDSQSLHRSRTSQVHNTVDPHHHQSERSASRPTHTRTRPLPNDDLQDQWQGARSDSVRLLCFSWCSAFDVDTQLRRWSATQVEALRRSRHRTRSPGTLQALRQHFSPLLTAQFFDQPPHRGDRSQEDE